MTKPQAETLNGAILEGLYQAVELVDMCNATGKKLKAVKVSNAEPLLIFENANAT